MPLVKGPTQRVILTGNRLVQEARAALASSTTCSGLLLGIGRDEAACKSVAARVDQVEQELLRLETRRQNLNESKPTSVSEAKKIVNTAALYVEELEFNIRNARVTTEWSLEPSFRGFGEIVRAVLRELTSLVVDIGKGAATGLIEGLGFWGLLAIGAVLYMQHGRRTA